MRPNTFRTLTLLATIAGTTQQSLAFEAHEWGTFTSLLGSNGKTQNGMYHEDERLPVFVHGFGVSANDITAPASPQNFVFPHHPCHGKGCFDDKFFQKNVITQKMETPVIYFYSQKEENIEVKVNFPEGLITETFPAPTSVFPEKSQVPVMANGKAVFQFKTLPSFSGNFPQVNDTNIYSHARNVASTPIQSHNENEKFIFYRGLGRFQPRLEITSAYGDLTIKGALADMPQSAFLVHVSEDGQTRAINLGDLSQKKSLRITSLDLSLLENHNVESGNILSQERTKAELAKSLVSAGLKQDEALAMLNTWENGYLKTPGLRLLYILPRAEVDQILPLSMNPAPANLARVFVARMEILLDSEETKIMNDIVNSNGQYNVNTLGRFAEPTLRRVHELYRQQSTENQNNNEMNSFFEKLIQRAALGDQSSAGVVN